MGRMWIKENVSAGRGRGRRGGCAATSDLLLPTWGYDVNGGWMLWFHVAKSWPWERSALYFALADKRAGYIYVTHDFLGVWGDWY